MRIRKYCQLAVQLLLLTLVKILLLPFTRRTLKLSGLPRGGCLVIANHRRALDPFIICGCLPYRYFVHMAPIGFMTHNVFYDSPLRPFAWLLGCFPARNPRQRQTLYGIEGSLRLLDAGCSVLIFPEGVRVRGRERSEAKPGAFVIHQARLGVPLVMCHISYKRFRARVTIMHLANPPLFTSPEALMDRVFVLH